MSSICTVPDSAALSEQRRLVARLCCPGVLPGTVQSSRLIETHISFVILAGQFAYKIKKALDLGFLDYTSLAKRLRYCQEELRLNRRLAAPIYLRVVAIGGSIDEPTVDGAPPAIEYAVQMREFDQESLLDNVLARGQFSVSEIDGLARLIADFHRQAPVSAADSAFGTGQSIEHAMLENLVALREARRLGAAAQLEIDAVEAWSMRRFAELVSIFESRRRAGQVRECHGDLHVGNMVQMPAGVLVFDCIEFSADLRWIDVMSEVAFFCMDLSARYRPDLAYRFLNAYLENSGDYEGLRVFRFYFVYRALVRAKVNWIRAGQSGLSAVERAATLDACRAYIALAAREVTAQRAWLILMHGYSGSGKTHFARRLLGEIPLVGIRSDVERKRLHHLAPLADSQSAPNAGIYSPAATAVTYGRLRALAAVVLDSGYSVLIDAAFLRRWQREQFQELARSTAAPLMIVDCVAPPGVLVERLAQRQRSADDASEADVGVLERQLASAEALEDEVPGLVVRCIAGEEASAVDEVRRLVVGGESAAGAQDEQGT